VFDVAGFFATGAGRAGIVAAAASLREARVKNWLNLLSSVAKK
jgi:hypothetical protein